MVASESTEFNSTFVLPLKAMSPFAIKGAGTIRCSSILVFGMNLSLVPQSEGVFVISKTRVPPFTISSWLRYE